jgi:hypothetical protein
MSVNPSGEKNIFINDVSFLENTCGYYGGFTITGDAGFKRLTNIFGFDNDGTISISTF